MSFGHCSAYRVYAIVLPQLIIQPQVDCQPTSHLGRLLDLSLPKLHLVYHYGPYLPQETTRLLWAFFSNQFQKIASGRKQEQLYVGSILC